ncbi:hypothetical protein APR11_004447 [Nocardia amikacinitolerans]|nr:hypothetical protein [Nocardia amikacinitolerans]MCP2320150.1 hypothetical protein [Nocardia amikacinitolerans]
MTAQHQPKPFRHLHIESGAFKVDFQGSADQIADVAAQLSQSSVRYSVTVDDHISIDMPMLPCAILWK